MFVLAVLGVRDLYGSGQESLHASSGLTPDSRVSSSNAVTRASWSAMASTQCALPPMVIILGEVMPPGVPFLAAAARASAHSSLTWAAEGTPRLDPGARARLPAHRVAGSRAPPGCAAQPCRT